MADTNIQTSTRIPDISDLLCGVPMEIVRKSFPESPVPLTQEEINELKRLDKAAANTHAYACMGLDVVEKILYWSKEQEDNEALNSASALTSLLKDLLHHSEDTRAAAQFCLLEHYKRIVENEVRKFVEIPVLPGAKADHL